MTIRIFALGAILAAGCTASTDKSDVDEDFGELAAAKAGGKADHIESMIVGSLDYGQTSALVAYRDPPLYRIFKFAADTGDVVDVRVTSTSGDAMAWVLDDSFVRLAFNDDATASTVNAAIHLEIPAHPSRTHYIVFRDYYRDDASFRVSLAGQRAGCQRDAECEMVEAGCCHVGNWTAVPVDEVEAFEADKHCVPNQICPLLPIVYKGEQAICNVDTRECEIALPAELDCGGRTTNMHSCPDGWQCMGDGLASDRYGSCVETCGGFGNFPCEGGLNCVDDPLDDCDPQGGGADCSGICVTGTVAGCDLVGCEADGDSCRRCSGTWQCKGPGESC